MNNDVVEVKRCPFCGTRVRAYPEYGLRRTVYLCPNVRCGASVTFDAGLDKSKMENTRLWNRRAEF